MSVSVTRSGRTDFRRSRHRTVDTADAAGLVVIGRFGGPAGEQRALVRGDGAGATLEEIVLGYLASARAGMQLAAA